MLWSFPGRLRAKGTPSLMSAGLVPGSVLVRCSGGRGGLVPKGGGAGVGSAQHPSLSECSLQAPRARPPASAMPRPRCGDAGLTEAERRSVLSGRVGPGPVGPTSECPRGRRWATRGPRRGRR